MNGTRPKPWDELGDTLDEVVFFPGKPARRVTLWHRATAEAFTARTYGS